MGLAVVDWLSSRLDPYASRPLCAGYPSKKQAYRQDTVLTAMGWGVDDDNYNVPRVLQEVRCRTTGWSGRLRG